MFWVKCHYTTANQNAVLKKNMIRVFFYLGHAVSVILSKTFNDLIMKWLSETNMVSSVCVSTFNK